MVVGSLKLPDLGAGFDHTRLRFTTADGTDRPLGTALPSGRAYSSGAPRAIKYWVQLQAGETSVTGTLSVASSARTVTAGAMPAWFTGYAPPAALLPTAPAFCMAAMRDCVGDTRPAVPLRARRDGRVWKRIACTGNFAEHRDRA